MRHLILLLLLAALLSGCYQDDTIVTTVDTGVAPPPTIIRTTVTTVVVDERGNPLDNATISGLNGTTEVTVNGDLRIDASDLSTDGTLVTVSSPGKWPERRLLVPAGDGQLRETFVLEDKVRAGTIDPAAGGRIDLADNFSVTIPANAVVTDADGNPYDGPVEVYVNHDAPEDATEMLNSPGNAPAMLENGSLANLESYGMMDLALEAPDGTPLTLDANNPAEVRMPLLPTTTPTAPNTIPFWFLDPAGFWQDAGTATLGDDCYVVFVNVSGGYNCDIPRPAARLCGRLVDANGYPLTHMAYAFHISDGWSCWNALTDCNGEFCALVAADTELTLFVTDECTGEVTLVAIDPVAVGMTRDLGGVTVDLPISAFPVTVASCAGGDLPADTELWANGYGGEDGEFIPLGEGGVGFVSLPNCVDDTEVFVQAFTRDLRYASRRIQQDADATVPQELELCNLLSGEESFSLTIDGTAIPVTELTAIYWPDNGNFNWVLRAGALYEGEEYSFLLNFSDVLSGPYPTGEAALAIYRLSPGAAYGEGLVYVDPDETVRLLGTQIGPGSLFSATVTATMNLQDDVAQTVNAAALTVEANFTVEL